MQRWVLGAANVIQTIPSLALFGFLIPVPWIGGVGASTAIVALALYALLPIWRNTCTGIAGVDPSVIESARGMGMTPQQVLWQVQLPLAAPVLLAGIRVATVISIGVTTIAAAIGAGGLGVFIFRGVAMVNNQVILRRRDSCCTACSAGRSWPWNDSAGVGQQMSSLRLAQSRRHFLLFLATLCSLTATGCRARRGDTIVVGSKNFTEQIILAELFAQQIEAHSTLHVERRVNLGGTLLCHQALISGKIDLYPEYTGTALTAVLNDPPQNDPSAVFTKVQSEYGARFGVEVMPPLGFNNTFAMVVRGDDAAKLGLRNISDMGIYAPKWRAGFGYEFMERPDGYRGWAARRMACIFPAIRGFSTSVLLYRALADHQVDIVAGELDRRF